MHNKTYNYRIPQREEQSTANQQQQNHHLRTNSNLRHWDGGGGLYAFYWNQIFALDSTQKISSWASVGPAADKHEAPTIRLKLNVRAIFESKA